MGAAAAAAMDGWTMDRGWTMDLLGGGVFVGLVIVIVALFSSFQGTSNRSIFFFFIYIIAVSLLFLLCWSSREGEREEGGGHTHPHYQQEQKQTREIGRENQEMERKEMEREKKAASVCACLVHDNQSLARSLVGWLVGLFVIVGVSLEEPEDGQRRSHRARHIAQEAVPDEAREHAAVSLVRVACRVALGPLSIHERDP